MRELIIAGAAFFLGSGIALGAAAWHQARMRRVLEAQHLEDQTEAARLKGRVVRLEEDLRYAEGSTADLKAQRELAAEYDRGYLDGLHHGVEMGDVERMAYSLDQKQPGRVLRMARYQAEGRISG